MYKACWIESTNKVQLKDFMLRKANNMAKDKQGKDVFLAESRYELEMAQEKYPDIVFSFKSEV